MKISNMPAIFYRLKQVTEKEKYEQKRLIERHVLCFYPNFYEDFEYAGDQKT